MLSFLTIIGFGVMVYFGIAAFRFPEIRLKCLGIAIGGAFLFVITGYPRIAASTPPSNTEVVANGPTTAPNSAPTSNPTEAATPKPDYHAEREKIQTYWHHVIDSLAIANGAAVGASSFVQDADLVSASQMLKQGRGAADQAKEMSQKDVPDGFDEIRQTLLLACDDFANSLAKESDYIDSSTPSAGAEALSQKQNALGEIEEAQHAARLRYVELGGKSGDLESFADAAKAVHDMVKMLSK